MANDNQRGFFRDVQLTNGALNVNMGGPNININDDLFTVERDGAGNIIKTISIYDLQVPPQSIEVGEAIKISDLAQELGYTTKYDNKQYIVMNYEITDGETINPTIKEFAEPSSFELQGLSDVQESFTNLVSFPLVAVQDVIGKIYNLKVSTTSELRIRLYRTGISNYAGGVEGDIIPLSAEDLINYDVQGEDTLILDEIIKASQTDINGFDFELKPLTDFVSGAAYRLDLSVVTGNIEIKGTMITPTFFFPYIKRTFGWQYTNKELAFKNENGDLLPTNNTWLGLNVFQGGLLSPGFNTGSTRIGLGAAVSNQGVSAVAVGSGTGHMNQGNYAVALGSEAGELEQGNYSVAIGTWAGQSTQGDNSIAVGFNAGRINQGYGGIILNSSGNEIEDETSGHIHINSSKASIDYTSETGWNVTDENGTHKLVSGGNAQAEFYHYSFKSGVDNNAFFDDGLIRLSWDSPGNDLEVYMLTEPNGNGDLISLSTKGNSSVVSTYITEPNFKYDVYPAGVNATEGLVVWISAEDDESYPSYKVYLHNAGSSYNSNVEVKKIVPKI